MVPVMFSEALSGREIFVGISVIPKLFKTLATWGFVCLRLVILIEFISSGVSFSYSCSIASFIGFSAISATFCPTSIVDICSDIKNTERAATALIMRRKLFVTYLSEYLTFIFIKSSLIEYVLCAPYNKNKNAKADPISASWVLYLFKNIKDENRIMIGDVNSSHFLSTVWDIMANVQREVERSTTSVIAKSGEREK